MESWLIMIAGSVYPFSHWARRGLTIVGLLAGLVTILTTMADEPPQVDDTLVEIGRQIYEEGTLPDGTPLEGVYWGGGILQGERAACITCHRRSGYGSFEGNVMVPPITTDVLFMSGPHFVAPGPTPTGSDATLPWYRAMTRPAYDEGTLARAIREGIDPDGDALMAPMPQFTLDDAAYRALFAYLSQLSGGPTPGISSGRLHLATIVTPDAPTGAPEAIVGVLRAWASQQQRWEIPVELHVWRLSGPPRTWEAQLQAQFQKQPVFALLSGAGGAEWSPVQRFCERAEIPCVLPSIDLVPEQALRGNNRQCLYFSPGVVLEAELLARHLAPEIAENRQRPRLVQIYGDPSGKRAAESLRGAAGALADLADDRKLHRIAPAAALNGVSDDDVLILWLRPPELMALIAQAPLGPPTKQVYLSAFLAPPDTLSLPSSWKERVTYVSLFDDWNPESAYSRTWLRGWLERVGQPEAGHLRVQADAYGASYFFTRAFAHMEKKRSIWRKMNLTGPFLLESLESVVAKNTGNPMDISAWVPLYKRLSLASGQRIAARDGNLLRYASPRSDQLVLVDDARTSP